MMFSKKITYRLKIYVGKQQWKYVNEEGKEMGK